ncbi:MAG: hypothetical protein AAFZ63_17215 [Bacteroidota bacterium]
MKTQFLTIICLCFLSTAVAQAPKPWTEADREAYAHRNEDSTKWDREMFADDLEFHQVLAEYLSPAIAEIPSPLAEYEWGYGALMPLKIEVEGKQLIGYTLAYAKDSYRAHMFTDQEAFYHPFFNLIVLTDSLETEQRSSAMISRNYPHYMSTGKFKTSAGDLDWVQMQMADGQNFAIVSQRYLDLTYGQTVLVALQKDGSIRIRQIKLSPESITKDALFSGEPVEKMESFKEQLAKDPTLIEFFTSLGSIDQQ